MDWRIDLDLDWHFKERNRCVAISSQEISFLTGCGKRSLFITGRKYKKGSRLLLEPIYRLNPTVYHQ
jgi:hypothetical protein